MDDKIISLSEWKRMHRRVNNMTLPELAMTVHTLIDVMMELSCHLSEVKDKLEEKEKS